jgi:hypothetical protein
VPDKRHILSPIRTPSRKSAKFTVTIASSALALTAVAAGTAAASSASSPARPAIVAGISRPAQAASAIAASGPAAAQDATAPQASAQLDGSAQPYFQVQLDTAGLSPAVHGASQSRKPAKKHHARHLSPRQIAKGMLHSFHWSLAQYKYLNWLWERESSWNVHASNPFSGAYGIPQAVPGAKMASAGPAWRTDAATQIRWGLRYIRAVYGSPQRAWDHEVSVGWY